MLSTPSLPPLLPLTNPSPDPDPDIVGGKDAGCTTVHNAYRPVPAAPDEAGGVEEHP